MGRPTREQAARSALLEEIRRLDIEAMRACWRTCPAPGRRPSNAKRACNECAGNVCARMREKGLNDDGAPLPVSERPMCGAKTRQGKPCPKKVVPGKKRCRYHGGLSTGPRTDAGRARIVAAQKRRWRSWKARHPSKSIHDAEKGTVNDHAK